MDGPFTNLTAASLYVILSETCNKGASGTWARYVDVSLNSFKLISNLLSYLCQCFPYLLVVRSSRFLIGVLHLRRKFCKHFVDLFNCFLMVMNNILHDFVSQQNRLISDPVSVFIIFSQDMASSYLNLQILEGRQISLHEEPRWVC